MQKIFVTYSLQLSILIIFSYLLFCRIHACSISTNCIRLIKLTKKNTKIKAWLLFVNLFELDNLYKRPTSSNIY